MTVSVAAALALAGDGYSIFPLKAGGKEPANDDGFLSATQDEDQIRQWWRRRPLPNVGVRTGVDGLVVLDIDHKDGRDGAASLKRLEEQLGALPLTRTVLTPSGGMHLYLLGGDGIRCSSDALAIGIDVRGVGGYVVGPGSSVGDKVYQLDGSPQEATLPDAWREALLVVSRNRDAVPEPGERIPKGQRNDKLFHVYARSLNDLSLTEEEIRDCLRVIEHARCEPDPHETDADREKEIAKIAHSAAGREGRGIVVHGEGLSSSNSFSSSPLGTWPEIDKRAYHGLAGDVVRAIEPHTEADPVAILMHLLVGFGSLIGRSAYCVMESDWHYSNLFAVAVGETSKGRKGTSWNRVRWPLEQVDPEWAADRIMGGLSSGEGLIKAVCDDQEKFNAKGESSVIPGVKDKRLLVFEAEFSSVLKQCSRDQNILSAVIREAWDTGHLRNMTVDGRKATGAHISIAAHVTKAELIRQITETDAANGFGNRFLWYCVRRSRMLPRGGGDANLAGWVQPLRDAVTSARGAGEIGVSDAAWELWDPLYAELSTPPQGLLGPMTSRAEAQVRRIAMLYALLDSVRTVDVVHLEAALALWQYCADSARYIFGERLGDPTADAILAALHRNRPGLTRKQISVDVFSRNVSSAEIDRALGVLLTQRLATPESVDTGGRPAELWKAENRG